MPVDDNKVDDNKVDDNKVDDNKVDDNKVDDNKVDDNKTLAAGGDTKPHKPGSSQFPDDWRDQLAGDDEAAKNILARIDSPKSLAKKIVEQEKKIRSGIKPIERPGKDATDEDWASYRKNAGIPEKEEEYIKEIKLSDGREIGESDKPVAEYFAKRMYERGAPVADMNAMVEAYYDMQEQQVLAMEEAEEGFKSRAVHELQEHYGGNYKASMNAIDPYFQNAPEGLMAKFLGARIPNPDDPSKTIRLGNDPDFIKFIVAKSMDENPAVTIVPTSGNQLGAVQDEIKEIRTVMRTEPDKYWKDPKMQNRLKDLLAAQDKLNSRAS